jgi:5'-deoxynucleotidase YfbR-like HD superfamily hydrolase
MISNKRFLVALSFPGEHRPFVAQVADALAQQVGRERVLYDHFFEHEFARPNLDTHLQKLYHDDSELVVVFLGGEYARTEWPGLEWRAVRDLIKKKRDASVMLVRTDDKTIPGMFSIDGYIDMADHSPISIAILITERLQSLLEGRASKVGDGPSSTNVTSLEHSSPIAKEASSKHAPSHPTRDALEFFIGDHLDMKCTEWLQRFDSTEALDEVISDFYRRPSKGKNGALLAYFGSSVEKATPRPMFITGPAGSGKTLLLHAIRTYFNLRGDTPSRRIVIYVDLRQVDAAAPVAALSGLAERLRQLDSASPNSQVLLLVDSVHMSQPASVKLYKELKGIFDKAKMSVARVVAVAGYSSTTAASLGEKPQVISLESLPADHEDVPTVVNAFHRLVGSEDPAASTRVKDLVRDLGVDEVDLFVLRLLTDLSEYNVGGPLSLSDYCENLCRERLARFFPDCDVDQQLVRIADVAHKHFVSGSTESLDTIAQVLVGFHSIVDSFLVARYIVDQVRRASAEDVSLDRLNFVYPQHIDRFGKEMMNRTPEVQSACVDGISRLLHATRTKGGSRYLKAKTHLCYMAGRFTDPSSREHALHLLSAERAQWQTETTTPSTKSRSVTKPDLLYKRSVYISLAYLGDIDAAQHYVHIMLSNKIWDQLNRGFHLEYYGDIAHKPDADQMVHVDELRDYPRTFAALDKRIRKALAEESQGSDRLLDIELYTFLSLAQHRQAAGKLSEVRRTGTLSILQSALSRVSDGELQDYARMLRANLATSCFSPFSILDRLYSLKTLKRKGWVKRAVPNSESVADHIYGALILGTILLPDANPAPKSELWRGYKKREVLRMILAHDLAEAFTGDLLPEERDENALRIEAEWYGYLGAAETYEQLFGLRRLRDNWNEFDQMGDLNARVANDLDKLDNLMQLLTYRHQGLSIEGWEKWKANLSRDVNTEAGRSIRDQIIAYFHKFKAN